MTENLTDPYLSSKSANFYDKLSTEIDTSLKAVKKLPAGQLEKHPDTSVICRYKYYQEWAINFVLLIWQKITL